MVANPGGSRVTLAAVGWNGDEVMVGLPAIQFGGRNRDKVVLKGNKRNFFKVAAKDIEVILINRKKFLITN